MQLAYRPPPPLADFVDRIWLWQGEPKPSHARERVLPDGSMAIIINLHAERIPLYDRSDPERVELTSASLLVAEQSRFEIIDAVQPAIAGVHFRPGGAFPFFEAPGGELHDRQIPLDDLWPASFVREQMLAATTAEAKLQVLERELLRRMVRRAEPHPAVRFALRALESARSVKQVTEQLGISARRFVDVFRDEVGMSPKAWCRVRRFHQAIRRIHCAETIDWVDLALRCGYYDQAHFIHDFRDFAGVSPAAYRAARTPHANHVVLA